MTQTSTNSAQVVGSTDDTTVSIDAMRTGWTANEPQLTPAQVSSADFGQLFATTVDGQVYAQPLVIGSTVLVATENNFVYGIHAVTGAVLWSRSLGPAWPASAIGCGDLVPNLGVTATPVYDASSGLVYVTAKVNDGPDEKHPHWYLHALDLATGLEHPGWPVTIQGAPANDPSNPIIPFTAHQRPGLLLLDGEVFAGFGSHCDAGPYVGYVVGVRTDTRAIRLWATQDAAGGKMAGVWMGGDGPVSDGPGRIFLSTGNGISPAPGPGKQPPGHLAESVVRVAADAGPDLVAKDFFSPSNADDLDNNDQDLGSGGPVALPSPPFGTAAHPNLMVQIGKDGRVFLLDRDDLGGRSRRGVPDAALSVSGPFRGVWGHPAVWGGDGGYVYVAENDGVLRALSYGVSGTGLPVLTSAGTSSGSIGHYPGSPVVSSTGTTSGSALVWVTCPGGSNGSNAQLRAYDAVPVNGVLRLRWSAPIGTAVKFPVAAVSNGRVYVGTRDGQLLAFGRPAQGALIGTPVDFGQTAVGNTGTATVTVTATRAVTITAVATTAPFAIGSPAPALPVTLNTGQTFDVPVTFTPTGAGGATATLSFSVTVGGAAGTVGLDLHGTGTQPGFGASPPTLAFGELATGQSETLSVTISNTGTSAETVATTTAPAAPFSASGLPAAGAQIDPGASVTVSVSYTPTVASPPGGDSSQLTVTGADGLSVTVPLTGSAVVGAPHLTISPTSVDFGEVPVGGSATRTFDLSNTGNLALTITKAAPPTPPFAVPNPVAEGQQINPGDVIHQAITLAPTATGSASGQYLITGNDGQGAQTVRFTGTAVQGGTVPAPSADGWTLNGSAAFSGTDLVLTPAASDETGSALYPTAVPTAQLHARFTASIGGGSGADGLAFVLLDAGRTTEHALGVGGGGLGYAGLPGVAVTLDTYQNGNDPSANFVGVATQGTGDALSYASTAQNIPNLRNGPHTIEARATGGHLQVSVDGTPVIDTAVQLPSPALVGFTAATGGLNDAHTVSGVTVTY
ncbi:choice-of-anchor D domain-containing protein [Kitasatospora azatica]|uniref:choice-of-anchor D domain-containing protein n=1 Tax=Kitasatospora azatica TaxID=58347 RepID=UPI000691FBD8|nr:choice-of-anchor D domain-containing protein [Kitasatospora azatica]